MGFKNGVKPLENAHILISDQTMRVIGSACFLANLGFLLVEAFVGLSDSTVLLIVSNRVFVRREATQIFLTPTCIL